MVVGEVSAIHRDINLQNVWLRVLRDLDLDLRRAQNFANHSSAELDISKSDIDVAGGGTVCALEVASRDNCFLIFGALDGSVLRLNGLNDGSIVVKVAILLLVGNDLLPLLLVERKCQDCLRSGDCLWRVEDERVVVDLCDSRHIADVFTGLGLDKLSVEGLLVANGAIVVLELDKANATDLNARPASRRTSLRAQIVHKHVLIVGERVLRVTVVQSHVSAVVLSITRR